MKTSYPILLMFLFSISGCAARVPFIAATDCAKIPYCGQCASRGGCAWCGAANESSGGQCMAAGHGECSAPRAFCQTPDHCPPPPADASSATPNASAASAAPAAIDPSAEMKAIGPAQYGALKGALAHAFPQATVTNKTVDKIVRLLLYRGSGPNQDGSHREVALFSRRVTEKQHRLYLGDAIHDRKKSPPPAAQPMQSEFMMTLPMVRVTLPEAFDVHNQTVATELGEVDLSRDHLLGSIELIAEKYGSAQYLGYRPARVDLITPARLSGSRFAAIAVYLGYRNLTDRGPSFYMLEAGTATGDAKMIYFSPNMDPIASATSYYLPTPFVSMRNTYSGSITMQPAPNEDEPRRLVVRSYAGTDKDPYITVSVMYKRVPWLDLPAPIEITADAGARVALIAKTMGIASAVELQEFLAKLGKNLSWMEFPHFESAPAQDTPGPGPAPATP